MPMNRPTVKFGPGQPSRTSIVVAALRAFGAREPDASVRNPDWLAEKLITSEDLDLIAEHPISQASRGDYQTGRKNFEVAGMSNLMLVRTRFVDEQLQRAINEGATQVVILGAGFDTRAYRFAEALKDKSVFEVDYRSTQELKTRRLESAIGSVPAFVHFAEIDFKRDDLKDVLTKAGYQPEKKAFFIWEGVSMYLSEETVRSTLHTIARYSAPGSSLVMDFAGRAMIEMLERFPQLSQHKYTTNWGEPWIFGLPDEKEREFFAESGFEVREFLSFFGRDVVRRYLTRSDGRRFGSIRGGRPTRRAFTTVLKVIWMFLTRRSKWYALAALTVSERSRRL
jgi:methyltransferase (TIGR00027 family)